MPPLFGPADDSIDPSTIPVPSPEELAKDAVTWRYSQYLAALADYQDAERDADSTSRNPHEAELVAVKFELVFAIDAFVGALVALWRIQTADGEHGERPGIQDALQAARSRGGRNSARQRAIKRTEVSSALEDLQKRNPSLTTNAVIRMYLREKDPAWQAGTDEERQRKIAALARRRRRAAKK